MSVGARRGVPQAPKRVATFLGEGAYPDQRRLSLMRTTHPREVVAGVYDGEGHSLARVHYATPGSLYSPAATALGHEDEGVGRPDVVLAPRADGALVVVVAGAEVVLPPRERKRLGERLVLDSEYLTT